MKRKFSIKEDFSLMAILMIPVGIALNVVGDSLVQSLKLIVYLDTFGSVLCGMLAGPWVGCVCGVLTNIVTGILHNPTLIPYAITNGLVGLFAGYYARKWWYDVDADRKTKIIRWTIMTVVLTLVTTCSATPITVFMFGGVSGNGGDSMLLAGMIASGKQILASVFGVTMISSLLDKLISYVLCLIIIKVIPDRTKIKFSCGEQFVKGEAKAE